MKPGIYKGVSFGDYLAIDAINNSTLKEMRDGKTPKHLHWAMTHIEKDREAFRVGAATHCAVLEPERFKAEYAAMPRKFDMRKTGDKAEAAQFEMDHQKHIVLDLDEWNLATAMSKAVWENSCAVELLKGAGANEMTVIWIDEPTGLLCKARLDRFTSYHDWPAIVDFKTAQDASPRNFARAIADLFYHQQAAFYLDGLNTLDPRERRFVFLVVEKQEPYCVAAYELDETAIDEGRAQYRRALDSYAECKKSGNWPGYDVGINTLDLPKWAYELTQAPV